MQLAGADEVVGVAQPEQPGPRSFFTELLSSMSDLKFSRDGRYMLARDFMTLKLWDVNMEASPVATYPIHEHLKPRVCTLQSTLRPSPDLLVGSHSGVTCCRVF